jgi:hypothetical protein
MIGRTVDRQNGVYREERAASAAAAQDRIGRRRLQADVGRRADVPCRVVIQ